MSSNALTMGGISSFLLPHSFTQEGARTQSCGKAGRARQGSVGHGRAGKGRQAAVAATLATSKQQAAVASEKHIRDKNIDSHVAKLATLLAKQVDFRHRKNILIRCKAQLHYSLAG